jgi:predicted nuclease of predicted toxin-antitoxin system
MDFLPASDAKLEGVPDPGVLAKAAEQDRILVTHDFQTMPQHFADFLQTHGSSPGVLLAPQHLPVAEAIEELVLIWTATDPDEWRNRILRIPLP